MISLIFNFNASRTSSLIKIRNFLNFINQYDPIFVAIQEINITSAIQIFYEKFQVLVNIEEGSKDKKCRNCGHIYRSAFIFISYFFLEVISVFCSLTYGLRAV